MKRSIFVLLCACLLVACSEQKFDSQEIVIEPQSSEEFNAVLNSIASLNDKYDCDDVSTRSSGLRWFLHQVADYLGGLAGAKMGADTGMCAGYVTGSPTFGVVVGGTVAFLGSIGLSALASYIFDLLWPEDPDGGYVLPQPSTFDGLYNYQFDGTVGSAHNAILCALENNGKNYFNVNGNILLEEMFHDALEYEENLHIDGAVYNADYINQLKVFCNDLYAVLSDAKSRSLSNSQVYDEMFALLRVKGFSDKEVMNFKALSDALLPSISLDDEEVSAYENEFLGIIESSELDVSDKVTFATAGSIYIRSVQYWY